MLHGKELSFNNLLDLDGALAAAQSFTAPTVAIIKHTNPCGLACDDTLVEAYKKAHAGDPISAFGGLEDNLASQEDLEAWRIQTTNSFDLWQLPGHHFFIHTYQRLLLQILSRQLASR